MSVKYDDIYEFNRFSGYIHRMCFSDNTVTSSVEKARDTFETFFEKSLENPSEFLDLWEDFNLDRIKRQEYYMKILYSLPPGETASPAQVKKLLEDKYKLTFKYIGQDMAPMRYWQNIRCPERGKYSLVQTEKKSQVVYRRSMVYQAKAKN